MIEFKAECGHTIRARDEDTGGVVRCSYCGREAAVPEADDSSLDFLFQDVRQPVEQAGKIGKRKRLWRRGIFSRRRHGEFDPFAVIFQLCWAALLIIIVIVVGAKLVKPAIPAVAEWWDGLWGQRRSAPPPIHANDNDDRDSQGQRDERGKPGLIRNVPDFLVTSTPLGATGYWMEVPKDPPNESICRLGNSTRFKVGTDRCKLKGGREYLVEIMFFLHAPQLVDYPGYIHFSKRVINASADRKERSKLVNDYFMPDGAEKVFIAESDRTYIARRYRVAVPNKGKPKPVRALFLPRRDENGTPLSVEALLEYIPVHRQYSLDDDYVKKQLRRLYEVPERDVQWVHSVLSRIGVLPYVTPDQRAWLLKIHPEDGFLDAERLN